MARIEILTIGDELVEGRLLDTNARELSELLVAAGFAVAVHTTVGDDRQEIVRALAEATSLSDAVLVSGGLGPTSDDLTAACAAEAFGRPIVRYPEAMEHIRTFFASRDRVMSPTNEKQADLPEGATLLPNPIGTALGFSIRREGCRLYFMPGVPRELLRMFHDTVLPDLERHLEPQPVEVATLKTFGKGESDVAQMLEDLGADLPPDLRLTVQYRATFPENHVRLLLSGKDAAARLEQLVAETRQRLGTCVFAVGGARLDTSFAEVVVEGLRRAGLSFAAVEAASRGELSRLATAVAGAEDVFRGAEVRLLEPLQETAEAQARELAAAARARHGADLGVATLGSALGSALGSSQVLAGSLWVAVATGSETSCRSYCFPVGGDRFSLLAAYIALGQLARLAATSTGS
jgi:nicotinamide-nucleotide amidase